MIRYYFDEMMSRLVAEALQKRGYDVVMASDVDMIDKDDDLEHLPYATVHQLVLVTMDKPFAGRTLARIDHTGLVCWMGEQNNFGNQIAALSNFAASHSLEETKGHVFWVK
jgi:predicted nuclease of predicted toxin-antitoxin system